MKKCAWLLISALLLTACTVRSQQLDMARQVMAGGGGGDLDVEQFAWRMTFSDTEAKLYAISIGEGIVFANEDGLEVAFDGWDILVVSGMPGSLGMIRVDKRSNPRVHHVQGLDTSFEVRCEEPQRSATGWRVRCQHESEDRVFSMNHRISLSGDGRITRIEASLVPGVGPLVLVPLFDIEE